MVKFKKISILIAAAILGGGVLNGCNGSSTSTSSTITPPTPPTPPIPDTPLPSPELKVANVNSTTVGGLVYVNPNNNSTQVLITNSGSTNASNLSFSFDSDSSISSQLSVSNNQCSGALAPGSSCEISITLNNFEQSDINKSASLSIQFTDDNGKKFIQNVPVTVLNPDGVTTSFIDKDSSNIHNNLIDGSAYGLFISTNLSQKSALVSEKTSGEGFTVIDNPAYYDSLPNECNPATPLSQNQSCSIIIKNTLALPLSSSSYSGKLEIDANIDQQNTQQSIFDIVTQKDFEGIFGYNVNPNTNNPRLYDSIDGNSWSVDMQTYPNMNAIPLGDVYTTTRFIQNHGGSLFLQEYQSDPTKVSIEENDTGFISEYDGKNSSATLSANSMNLYSNNNGQVSFVNVEASITSTFAALYNLFPLYSNGFFSTSDNKIYFSSENTIYQSSLTTSGNLAIPILSIHNGNSGNCSTSNFYGSTLNNNLFMVPNTMSGFQDRTCSIYDNSGASINVTPNSSPILKYDEDNNKLEEIANLTGGDGGNPCSQISSFSDSLSNNVYFTLATRCSNVTFNYGDGFTNSLTVNNNNVALVSYNVSNNSWNVISNNIQLPGLNYPFVFAYGLGIVSRLSVNKE